MKNTYKEWQDNVNNNWDEIKGDIAALTAAHDEFYANIASDKTGEGFIADMFRTELENHGCSGSCYRAIFRLELEKWFDGAIDFRDLNFRLRKMLKSLDLTEDKLKDSKALQHGLSLALSTEA